MVLLIFVTEKENNLQQSKSLLRTNTSIVGCMLRSFWIKIDHCRPTTNTTRTLTKKNKDKDKDKEKTHQEEQGSWEDSLLMCPTTAWTLSLPSTWESKDEKTINYEFHCLRHLAKIRDQDRTGRGRIWQNIVCVCRRWHVVCFYRLGNYLNKTGHPWTMKGYSHPDWPNIL